MPLRISLEQTHNASQTNHSSSKRNTAILFLVPLCLQICSFMVLNKWKLLTGVCLLRRWSDCSNSVHRTWLFNTMSVMRTKAKSLVCDPILQCEKGDICLWIKISQNSAQISILMGTRLDDSWPISVFVQKSLSHIHHAYVWYVRLHNNILYPLSTCTCQVHNSFLISSRDQCLKL